MPELKPGMMVRVTQTSTPNCGFYKVGHIGIVRGDPVDGEGEYNTTKWANFAPYQRIIGFKVVDDGIWCIASNGGVRVEIVE
jgi:hypothetical protein